MIKLSTLREAIPSTTTERDAEIQRLDLAVTAMWERLTRRLWRLRTSHVQYWNPGFKGEAQTGLSYRTRRRSARFPYEVTSTPTSPVRDKILFTALTPVTLISVEEWDFEESEADAVEALAADYYVVASEGKLVHTTGFWKFNVKATMDGGWDPDDFATEFPDVVEAMITQIKFMLARNADPLISMNSQSFEAGSTSYMQADMHPLFMAAVSRFRKL